MLKNKKEEKNKVGRPKLADTELKRDSLVAVIVLMVVALTFVVVGATELARMTGYQANKLKGNVIDTNRLRGIDVAAKNKGANWDWKNNKLYVALEIDCAGYEKKVTSITATLKSTGAKLNVNDSAWKNKVCNPNPTHDVVFKISELKPKDTIYMTIKLETTKKKTKKTYTKKESLLLKNYTTTTKAKKTTKATKKTTKAAASNALTITCNGTKGDAKGSKTLKVKQNTLITCAVNKKATVTIGDKCKLAKSYNKSGTATKSDPKLFKCTNVVDKVALTAKAGNETKKLYVKVEKTSSGGSSSSSSSGSGGGSSSSSSSGSGGSSSSSSSGSGGSSSQSKVNKTTKKANSCTITLTDRKPTSAKYKLTCNNSTSISKISINNGAKVAKATGTKKTFTGNITKLNNTKYYTLSITVKGISKAITKKFYPLDEDYVKTLKKGTCPVAATFEKAANAKDGKAQIKITLSTSGINSTELKNLYLSRKSYNESRALSYNLKGKKTSEKIGAWNSHFAMKVVDSFKKDKSGSYYKIIKVGDYHYTAIWSGGKECYTNYFIKDGYTINNYYRKYKLSQYNIITKNIIIRGAANPKVKSSDSKVLAIKKITDDSCKATAQTAKSGNESSKTTKITMTLGSNSGSFSMKLPNRYYETGYLGHPLYKRSTGNTKATGITKGFTKTSNTKDSKGNKLYGIELSTKEGNAVYAMDAGTIYAVRKKLDKNDTKGYYVIIRSYINSTNYYHTYAHLKSINVAKGDRVYKGMKIGTAGKTAKSGKPLSKAILFISLTVKGSDGKYTGLTANNFIGRDLSYVNATPKATLRSYISDSKKLADKNAYCEVTPCTGSNCSGSKTTVKTTTKTPAVTTTVNPSNVTGVTLNKTALTLDVDKSETLIATVVPSTATNKSVTWSSKDSTIATVNTSGTVTCKKEGITTVTVTTSDGGKTASATVNCSNNPLPTTCSIALSSRRAGDADCDGKLTLSDVRVILLHTGSSYKITNEDTKKVSDLDSDNAITISDVRDLRLFIAGKTNKICCSTGKCENR